MDETFLEAWDKHQAEVKDWLATQSIENMTYESLLEGTVKILFSNDWCHQPDYTKIHVIDDGDYQGTLVFVIASAGYQPSDYWSTSVSYGSCSLCDTLQGIVDYEEGIPNEDQLEQLWTLCLHMMQHTKKIV